MTNMTQKPQTNEEVLAQQLHTWYLEATAVGLKEGEFNPNAQKSYEDMTEAQRNIDRYIARKILAGHRQTLTQLLERVKTMRADSDRDYTVEYRVCRAQIAADISSLLLEGEEEKTS